MGVRVRDLEGMTHRRDRSFMTPLSLTRIAGTEARDCPEVLLDLHTVVIPVSLPFRHGAVDSFSSPLVRVPVRNVSVSLRRGVGRARSVQWLVLLVEKARLTTRWRRGEFCLQDGVTGVRVGVEGWTRGNVPRGPTRDR